jgi:hypothetical protein
VSVGPVSLTLSTEAYMQLVALLNTSAANFELWMRSSRAGISEHGGARPVEGDL